MNSLMRRIATLSVASTLGVLPVLAGAVPAASADETAVSPGDCYDLTLEELSAHSLPATAVALDCEELHTAEVAAVVSAPTSVAKYGRSSREVAVWFSQECLTQLNVYAGVKRTKSGPETSRTRMFWFAPSKSEWAAGDRSFICIAASVEPMQQGDTWPLRPVTGSLVGSDREPLRFERLTKERRTVYTLIGFYPLAKSITQEYPGVKTLLAQADKACKRILGSDEGEVYFVPKKKSWRQGSTIASCWYAISYLR